MFKSDSFMNHVFITNIHQYMLFTICFLHVKINLMKIYFNLRTKFIIYKIWASVPLLFGVGLKFLPIQKPKNISVDYNSITWLKNK